MLDFIMFDLENHGCMLALLSSLTGEFVDIKNFFSLTGIEFVNCFLFSTMSMEQEVLVLFLAFVSIFHQGDCIPNSSSNLSSYYCQSILSHLPPLFSFPSLPA